MSDSLQPHRRQPTRLPRPWDSPGKNTGVGCHCLLQCVKVKSESEVAQPFPTLIGPIDCSPPGSSVHGISELRVLEWGTIAFSEKTEAQRSQHAQVHIRERKGDSWDSDPGVSDFKIHTAFRWYHTNVTVHSCNRTQSGCKICAGWMSNASSSVALHQQCYTHTHTHTHTYNEHIHHVLSTCHAHMSFEYGGISGQEPACQCRRHKRFGFDPQVRSPPRSPGGGHGNPLQYSCLENPLDRGVWRVTVRTVAKSQTQLKRLNAHPSRAKSDLF